MGCFELQGTPKLKMKQMKINIKDKEIELKYGFRAMMLFEEITGESFQLRGMKDLIVYFYSTIIASDKDMDIDFDGFIDWMDGNPDTLNEFGDWVINHSKKNDQFRTKNNTEKTGSDSNGNFL